MHIPEIEKALRELVRVVRPGGWLIIGEANADAPESYLFRIDWRLRVRDIRVVRKPTGVEAWAETSAGPLLSRKISAKWLTGLVRKLGMERISRTTGELTELYIYTSRERVRKLLHRLNQSWFKLRAPASLAIANYHLFRKAQ
jgi:SAM-dependent methyltransferase